MSENMIKGKTMEEASAITSTKLLENLGDLPKEHKHCATLAISTLHKAIEGYHKD
ncbi:MAG: iron-sulfur cluster assembly scaffold protein [Thermoplasmatales archaeon]|jgi:NifU-like protein involved in Fe-S cluster formation|nr:iron-sulfur cluster assembly scaffold protein [Thermoplasmatales archaeon]